MTKPDINSIIEITKRRSEVKFAILLASASALVLEASKQALREEHNIKRARQEFSALLDDAAKHVPDLRNIADTDLKSAIAIVSNQLQ